MGRFDQRVPQAGAGYEEGDALDTRLKQLEEKIDVAIRDGRVLDRLKIEVRDMRERVGGMQLTVDYMHDMQLNMVGMLNKIMTALKVEDS